MNTPEESKSEIPTARKGPCPQCGQTWDEPCEEPRLESLRARMSRGRCPACWDADVHSEGQKELDEAARRHRERWDDICPPLYRKTNLDDSRLSLEVRKQLEAWQYQKDCGLGLGIFGPTGIGKTRLVFWRLQQIYLQQRITPKAISSVKLEQAIHRSFHEDEAVRSAAEATIEACYYSPILFIDDVGKEKFTERITTHLYALIEHRTSFLLPTLWTTNMTAHELRIRLGDERGGATLRRLKEFSTIVKVESL